MTCPKCGKVESQMRKAFSVPMQEIVDISMSKGNYFFTPEAMKFFSSRLPKRGYIVNGNAYFITSEQFKNEYRTEPRMYTVHTLNVTTGLIDHINAKEMLTATEANAKLRELVDEAIIIRNGLK